MPKNIFSGFVVSLIALPLGIGLALASEFPPISGIITAVVGGVLIAILGGSNLTITGPGNGLVGVVAGAVLFYADQSGLAGKAGIQEGYFIVLAAIVCSGLLMLILGFLRLGKLSDYFPSSAIQGMLAAIGLIILGKQFHIMMGNRISANGNLDYLLRIPETIIGAFNYSDSGLTFAMLSGVISLAIMGFYSKIRNKYLQLIPAPMWIVIVSVGFSYYFELVKGMPNPIHADYMISGIPTTKQILSDLPTPNFSKIGTLNFWSVVLSLTIISSIESLLSIKAVDKLDPEKRRSNVNRDIKAIGFASVVAGLLGGLNVVTVIARSSVNINNGGTNRSANFFHALFLVVFIVVFSTELTRIPLPALMAILVYTGFKLAHPSKFKYVLSIGKEQALIFLVTLGVTISVGLIEGIIMGIITTGLVHLMINKSATPFVRNILKPNVLMYQEAATNEYFVSVKNFCTFINYAKLKGKLNAIPQSGIATVDFSLCNFVDHTVMESVADYEDAFRKKGGSLTVLGLGNVNNARHPFAFRKVITVRSLIPSAVMIKNRADLIKSTARALDYHYTIRKKFNVTFLEHFIFFKTKKLHHTYHEMNNDVVGFKIFDLEYTCGELITQDTLKTTMLHMPLAKKIPVFSIYREGLLERFYHYTGYKDIKLPKHPEFSKRFYVKGENEVKIQHFVTNTLAELLLDYPQFHIESNGKGLLIFTKERLLNVKELKELNNFAVLLKAQL